MKKLLLAALALTFSFTSMAQDDPDKPEKKESKGLSLEPGRTFDFDLSEGSWIAWTLVLMGRLLFSTS